MLFLKVFGGLSIENGGRPIVGAAGQRSRLLLLTLLAVSDRRGLTRERLHALLWPESDSERARNALNQAFFALRRDLGEENLIQSGSTLRLNPAVISSDVGTFLSSLDSGDLSSAVSVYAGPLLDGVHFRSGVEVENWLHDERSRLQELYVGAVRRLASQAESAGRFETAIDLWRKLAASDPLSSTTAASLMKALAASGDRAAAVRHGRIHSALVRDELGLEASRDLERLTAEILREGATSSTITSEAPAPAIASEISRPEAPIDADVVRSEAVSTAESTPSLVSGSTKKAQTLTRYLSKPQLFAVVLIALFFVAGVRLAVGFDRSHAKTIRLSSDANRIVVVPFQNRTADHSLDQLGALGADWITDGISRAQLIPVVDPETAAAALRHLEGTAQANATALAEIADATGAANIVTGSFYRQGDSLEFYARVVDARTGKLLGSIEPVVTPAAGSGDGIQVVRQRVLNLLAKLFDARMAQLVMPDAKPPSFDAYKEFVNGVDHWARNDASGEDLRGYFRRAYALDTTFLTPLTFLPSTYAETRESKPILDTLEARRNRLTPLDRHALDYWRADLRGDRGAVLAAAEAASDLAPRSEWSWDAGGTLLFQNRPHAALRYLSRLDPDHGWMRQGLERIWYAVAQAKHMTGDLEGARLWLIRARRKFPEDPSIAAAYARALALADQPDSVRPIVTEILQSDAEWRVFYVYSILADLKRHGRDDQAKAVYELVAPWYAAKGTMATESDRRDFGRILFDMHMDRQADAQFQRLVRDFRTSDWRTFYIGYAALTAAMRGDSTTALRLIDKISPTEIGLGSKEEGSYWRARVAAQLGHRDEAMRLLESSFADPTFSRLSLSHSMWYDFPTLQGYAPFESLVASDR